MKRFLMLALLLASCANPVPSVASETSYPLTPDERITPGDYCTRQDPDFDEERYLERIPHCKRNVSNATKEAVYRAYGLSYNPGKAFTIDHKIPLSMGGSNSKLNLWPQSVKIHTGKDEYYTFCRLRDGVLNQAAAIRIVLDIKQGLAPIGSVTQPANCADY